MPGFASLSIASALLVASLNLCSDEYLLLLAKPGEVASVTRLSQDLLESRLWKAARAHPANRGEVEGLLRERPTLLLTMGGGGRSSALLARRLGMRTLDLPAPNSVAGVADNLRRVATALGAPERARPWLDRIAALKANPPAAGKDAIFVSGGGVSLSPGSPGMEWMALAGLQQRKLPQGRADLETLLVAPPQVLLKSDYRRAQMSAGNRWLDHPIVRRLKSRTIRTDGRAWTCAGPLMIGEIERLRRLAR